MKPEAQRIAIAEACGRRTDRPETGWHDLGCNCQECYPLPDYLNSLDAMHKAEKVLDQMQARTYADHLAESEQDGTWASCHMWHQSADQRAEAFLKALNLWTE